MSAVTVSQTNSQLTVYIFSHYCGPKSASRAVRRPHAVDVEAFIDVDATMVTVRAV